MQYTPLTEQEKKKVDEILAQIWDEAQKDLNVVFSLTGDQYNKNIKFHIKKWRNIANERTDIIITYRYIRKFFIPKIENMGYKVKVRNGGKALMFKRNTPD